MRKSIVYGSVTCLVIALAMANISWKQGSKTSGGQTPVPFNAAKYKGEVDFADFDTTVKPQQDFYMFVNGNWLKKNQIPASEAAWGSFNVLNDSIVSRLKKMLKTAAADKQAQPGSIEQKVGDLFACMMDSVNLNKQGITPLNDEFAKINAISDNKSFWAEAAHLMIIGPDVMFGFGVDQDAKISTKEICQIGQGGLSLPSKEYYTLDKPMMKNLRTKFIDYATKMFMQMGETADAAAKDAQTVLTIETQMANVSFGRVELRDVGANYNKMTFAALVQMSPNIDWDACLQQFTLKSIDTVIVGQPGFMKGLSDLTKSVSLNDWKTYLKFHLLNDEASKLSDTLAEINFDYYGKTFNGLQERQARWKRSVQGTSRALGQLLGQLYVKKYFSPAAKERVHQMVINIIAAYKQRINQVTWMDPATKSYALAKLDKITLKLCYPDKWKDYSKLTIKRDSWVKNSFRINEFEFNYALSKLGKPVDRTEWGMSPQTVNAYYNPTMNEIVFPAAIMQPPFFDPSRDNAMNYGAMGAVIGHELTHGFDDQGSQFDANGNFHKWWTDNDSAQFHSRLQVIINQFNDYVIDSMHVKGDLTIGENTADLGGLTIAYQALQNDLKINPEGIVDGFTPEQRFFIAWAQAWRQNIRPDFQKQLITTNPHSPNNFRADGPPSNMKEFYEAFAPKSNAKPGQYKGFTIAPGDGMYRAESSRAVIW